MPTRTSPPPTAPAASWWAWFAAAFAAALVVHGALWLQYRGTPFSEVLVSDALSYHEQASRIAARGLAAEPVFHQSPLFPVLLGQVYRLAGAAWRADLAAWLLIALSSLAMALLVPIGRAYFGSVRAGIAAAAIALFHAPFVFHGLKLLPVSLALATQAFWLATLGSARERDHAPGWGLSGLALGLAIVARTEMMLLFPVALWLAAGGARPARRRWTAIVTLTLGTALVVAPATVHNLRHGDRVLVASSGGENLYIGNQRGADGGHVPLHPRAGDLFSQRILAEEVAEQARGRELRPSEVSAYWRQRALGEIAADPAAWLALEVRKLGRLLHPGDPTDIYSLAVERAHYLPLSYALAVPVWSLLFLGGLGLYLAVRRNPARVAPLVALLVLHLVVLLAFFVSTRLRLPFYFALTAFAGYAVHEGRVRWRSPAARRPLLAAAVATLLLGAVSVVATRPTPREIVRLGAVLSRQDRRQEALAVLEPAIRGAHPDPTALDQAGFLYQESGDLVAARDHYLRAFEHGLEGAAATQTRTRLAIVLEKLGDPEGSAAEHDRAVADNHANAWNHYERGMFRLRRGDGGGRLDIERANALDPHWDPPREALRSLRRGPC